MKKVYSYIDYFDVWYNDEEGFQVNDLARTDIDIIIKEDMDDLDILVELVEREVLNPIAVREKLIGVEWLCSSMIELSIVATGEPIGRLELKI